MKCMKFIKTFGENSRRETSLLIINALWSRISTQFRDFLLSRPRPGFVGPLEEYGDSGDFFPVTFVQYTKPIQVRGAEYAHQIVLSQIDLKMFHRTLIVRTLHSALQY